jgi:hypothetical protein
MARKRQAQHCTAHRTDGNACGGWAVIGGFVCAAHGGRAPQVQAAARDRLAVAVAARFGLDMTDITGSEALIREVRRSAAMVEFLAARAAELSPEELTWGTTKRTLRPDGEGGHTVETVEEARQNIWVVMLREERLVLAKVAAEAARAGVEERLARRAELDGAAMVQLIRAIFGDPELAMRPEQLAKMGVVVPRHLRAITGSATTSTGDEKEP